MLRFALNESILHMGSGTVYYDQLVRFIDFNLKIVYDNTGKCYLLNCLNMNNYWNNSKILRYL